MKLINVFILILITCHSGCTQTKIIGSKITNLPPKSINLEWHDQAISRKVQLILLDALPKIVEERNILHQWDLGGVIKIYNQLDSSLIEKNKQGKFFEKTHISLSNLTEKIPYKEKLDCLEKPFRYKFDFINRYEICDIIASPEILLDSEKFRYFKFNISKSEYHRHRLIHHAISFNIDFIKIGCPTDVLIWKNFAVKWQ